jgi:hypothetical protein
MACFSELARIRSTENVHAYMTNAFLDHGSIFPLVLAAAKDATRRHQIKRLLQDER